MQSNLVRIDPHNLVNLVIPDILFILDTFTLASYDMKIVKTFCDIQFILQFSARMFCQS